MNKARLSIVVAVLVMGCASLAMAKGKQTAKSQEQVFTIEVTKEKTAAAQPVGRCYIYAQQAGQIPLRVRHGHDHGRHPRGVIGDREGIAPVDVGFGP
jgi:aminopeptidase C